MITLSIRTLVRNAAAVFSGVLRGRHPASRAGRVQPTDRLRARPPGRAAVATRRPPHPPPAEAPVPTPALPLDEATQRRLAVTAFAMGISLRQIEDLLGVLLPADEVPDHSTIGRWVAGRGPEGRGRPGGARPGVRSPGPDPRARRDLFWGRPTLVGIEPASMTAVFCRNAADRKADDLGEATGAVRPPGVRRLRRRQGDRHGGRAAAPRPAATTPSAPAAGARPGRLPHRDGGQPGPGPALAACRGGLGEGRRPPTPRSPRSKQQGIDARGVARTARAAWGRAIASFEQAERLESAWGRAHAALDLFGADGRLNDRTRAEAEIAAALKDLTGPDWSKVRNFLNDPRSLAFLDRMHRRLESAEPRPEWREAMAWRWWLRHRRPPALGPAHGAGPGGGA